MNEKELMKLDMVKNLAALLMDYNPQMAMEQALLTLLNSGTYQRLMADSTGLYYQSPRYVFSFLENELKTGVVQ